ncbi:MAG: MBL fold metallo-hydrolase [Halobacteriota archaeon]
MVETITAERLADMIDANERFTLIDTRDAESFEAWHVQNARNVPYDPEAGIDAAQLDEIAAVTDGEPIVTICGKGRTSVPFGVELEERGYDVSIVDGGMEAWSKVYEVVPIEVDNDDLVVRQVQRRAKGCLGYVVGSRATDQAVVVDPTRQTDQFKAAAQDAGLTIERVLDTHVHADHISGGAALADDLGVPYTLGESARERNVAYDYEPLSDGQIVDQHGMEIEAFSAPGHTSEMMAYLVDGELLLTGDTLFVDSVGRTELQFGEGQAAHGAKMLFETLHETILELPADTTVLPGHLSVTNDGRYEHGSPGEAVTARLGDLHDALELLHLDRETFVKRLTEDIPEKPPNYESVIAINTGAESAGTESEATELELGPNNCAA